MPDVNAVVFDLGGVLLDWDPRHLYRRLISDSGEMEQFLARICNPNWHLQHDLGADIRLSCRVLAEQHPDYRDLIMAWADRGEEMVAGAFGATVDVLLELKAAGLPCYALSNMEPEAYAVRRERFAFMKTFDGCVISGIERVAKPDRRIFNVLVERYGLNPAATIFVDDMQPNVDAASALGFQALRFTSAEQLRHALNNRGIAVNQ